MAFPKLLLSVLIFIIATATALNTIKEYESPSTNNYQLPDYIKPIHYNTKLILINNDYFDGESNITILISLATPYLCFHSYQVNINHETITLTNKVNEVVYKLMTYSYNSKAHVNTIYFDEMLQPETYILYMKFSGVIVDNDGTEEGILRTSYMNELHKQEPNWLFATYSRAIGTRRVLPCWDEPALKATFNISVKHRNDWKAYSNSPILETRTDVNDMEWTHFNITPGISTHVMWITLLNMSDFIPVKTSVNNVTILCEKHTYMSNIELAHTVIENVTVILRSLLILRTEIANMYHVIIPDYHHQITENWAVAFYRKKDIMYSNEIDSIARKAEVAYLVALKTTHQWFVNTISPSRWSYLWLNEALSTWVGTLILNKIMPDLRIMDLFLVQIQHEFLHLDTNSLLIPVTVEVNKPSEINSLFTFYHYVKAPVILRMLYHILTPDVFWNGLRTFINMHQFNSATPDDLWTAMQNALSDSDKSQFIDFDINTTMNTWITEKNYPTLSVTQNYKTGYIQIKVLSNNDSASNQSNWFIPITYTTRTNPNFTQIGLKNTTWLKPSETSLTLSQISLDDWIIINVQQTGYYRVKYDKRNWRRLARYLASCEYNKIHVLNRAQIIDDAFHFLMAGQLELSTFLELSQYLKQETDYIAWYPMIKAFEYMSGYLPFSGSTIIKEHMRRILNELLNNLGFKEKPDEDFLIAQLRQEAIKWACTIGDSQCSKAVSTEINHYLEQSTEQFSLGWNKWSHCKGLISASADDWNRMISIWEKNQDRRILEFLACSEDPDIIYRHSKLLISTTYLRKIRALDHTRIFFNIVARHAKNDNVLNFLLENFEKVKPRKVSAIATLTVMSNYVYSKEQLTSIIKLAKDETREEQFLEIESKIKMRMAQIENQLNHFKHLSK